MTRPTKRCIALGDEEHRTSYTQTDGNTSCKLRRLPHWFSKMLELPVPWDAEVLIEETPKFMCFVAKIEGGGCGDVRVLAVDIFPGMTKIVVRDGIGGGVGDDEVALPLAKLDMDTWRITLPDHTQPKLSTAVFEDGELVVTVPKVGAGKAQGGREYWRGGGRLIPIQ